MAILHTLKENLVMAQNCMKQQAYEGRSECELSKGHQVFLHLQPYNKTSLKSHHCRKLIPKFYDPYHILKRVGPMAYLLYFTIHSKIQPIFHVSCLKKVLDTRFHTLTSLPKLDE
jgi:hypothetical protein